MTRGALSAPRGTVRMKRRHEQEVIHGREDRFVLVIGPMR